MRTPTFSVEVITLPVIDVNRTLCSCVDQVGFTLDVDYRPSDAFRRFSGVIRCGGLQSGVLAGYR